MTEIRYHTLEDYPNYAVTDEGRVFSHKSGFWLKPRIHKQGYIQVALYRAGCGARASQKMVHRLVAQAFIPNPDGLPEINHKDGDKKNNRVSNLEWSTRKANQRHATDTGLWQPHYGERHGMSKLTVPQVRRIKAMRGQMTTRQLADECGVSTGTIRLIWSGGVWRQVEP